MAYADIDNGKRFSPASLSAAMLVNGGMVALIAFAAPSVIKDFGPDAIPTFNTATTPPTPVTRDDKPDPAKTVIKSTTQRPPIAPPTDNHFSETTNTLDDGATGTGGEIAVPNPPEIITPPAQPIHIPVRSTASVDPRFRAALQPAYPPGLVRGGIEGSATVRVLIGVDGRVKAVEAVRADEDGFLAATREQALRKWRFKPATEDGSPVESWREMTVTFRIDH
jgi:periplasmic protein TonB